MLAGAGAYAVLDKVDLASWAAARASRALGRTVSIASLHVTPGRWVRFELRQGRVDNLPGGTEPAYAEVNGLTGEVEATSLLHGPLVVRALVVDGLHMYLEHVSGGAPNWRFGPAPADGPADRAWFPTLLDAHGTGDIRIRTSSGAEDQVRFDQLAIQTQAADQPVHANAQGAYNGVPLGLLANLAPIAVLRQTAVAYPMDLRFTSGDTLLTVQATTPDPFTLDHAHGPATLEAPTPDALYRLMKIESAIAPAIHLAGTLDHAGPTWQLSEAKGALDASPFTKGFIKLTEGGNGQPDAVALDLAFDHLDLNALLKPRGGSGSNDDMSLAVGQAPDPLLDLKLSAQTLVYAGVHANEVALAAQQRPGTITMEALSMAYLGAKIRATGAIKASDAGHGAPSGTVSADIEVEALDIQALRRLLGIRTLPLLGRVDGQVALAGAGTTLNAAMREAHISAIAEMAGGSVAREVIELASTDARTLLRSATGTTPVSCAVGVFDIRAGAGTVSPLRIEAEAGTIAGKGRFDLHRGSVDVTVASESRTTSLFALDVPLHITGSLSQPTIVPAALSSSGRAELASGDDVSRLPPALQSFARRSRCLAVRR